MNTEFLEKAIEKVSWKTIHDYYKKNKVEWKFNDKNNEPFFRLPTLEDLKADLRNAINFVFTQNLTHMDYGNWVIFWTDPLTAENLGLDGPQLEVLFVLSGALVTDVEEYTSEEIFEEAYEENLKNALEAEDYILAARIRDQIQTKNKVKVNV